MSWVGKQPKLKTKSKGHNGRSLEEDLDVKNKGFSV